ncbi:MAG: condensation domain-containing protein [Synergistaceae bacterium]|nr:condensation domain-containing protein [Synergistaceae bacterium]
MEEFSLNKKFSENCETHLCKQREAGETEGLAERNACLQKMDAPLSFWQSLLLKYQLDYPDSISWNVPLLVKFGCNTDIARLKKAVDTVLATHPVFSVIYLLKGDEPVQRYVPNKKFDTTVEEVTEAELETIKRGLVRPFEMLEKPLYRLRLFKTEKGEYLFCDFHHSIVDGVSRYIFFNDICDAYEGKPLKPDYYFAAMDYRQGLMHSSRFEEGRKYYDKLFEGYEKAMPPRLKIDMKPNDNPLGTIREMIPIAESFYEQMQRVHGLNKNAFFIIVSCFVLSAYNEKDAALLTWIHNGRHTFVEKSVFGFMYQCYPVGLCFDDTKTLSNLYREVKEQIHNNKHYSCFPYPGRELRPEEKGVANFNYLKDLKYLRDFAHKEGLSYTVSVLSADVDQADNLLEIEVSDIDDGCFLELKYNASAYKKESINRFKNMFMKTACLLMEHIENHEMKVMEIISAIRK